MNGDADKIRDYFASVLPSDAKGWLTGNIGYGGHYTATGKYEFTRFPSYAYRWPDQTDEAIAYLEAEASHADAYACPYLMRSANRNKGNTIGGHRLVHADVDHDLDLVLIADLAGFAVGSGTDQHGHAYVKLLYPILAAQHEVLCRGLVTRFGGDPAKWSDNDLLRPAGTLSHKSAARGGAPTLVDFL